MNKLKVVAYIFGIYVVGAGTGYFVSKCIDSHISYRIPESSTIIYHFRNHLTEKVSPSDSQMKQIDPILKQAGASLEQIHRQATLDIHKTILAMNTEVEVYLTPEQKQKWDQWQQERERSWQEHNKMPPIPAP